MHPEHLGPRNKRLIARNRFDVSDHRGHLVRRDPNHRLAVEPTYALRRRLLLADGDPKADAQVVAEHVSPGSAVTCEQSEGSLEIIPLREPFEP
jgi:hypothetical protein